MSTPDLTFDPTMPYALELPWPAPWGGPTGVQVVYDLYRAMAYVDDQGGYMAESRRGLRALKTRLAEIDALPDEAEKSDQTYEWNRAYNVWQRSNAIRQLQYFVLRVEFPGGQDRPGKDPDTWARFPTALVVWLADEGYEQARSTLWDPKSPTPATPLSSSAPSPPL